MSDAILDGTRPICPKAPFWLFSPGPPPLRIPTPCGRYLCTLCGDRKVQQLLRVVSWAAAVRSKGRFLTLTLVPDDWQQARTQLRDFARRVRKHHRFEWAWALEPNPKGTGTHLHAITHGDFMPQRQLAELWGGRRVWIEEAGRGTTAYVQKCAAVIGYNSKAGLGHLEKNGGRAVHLSRGFCHGLTVRQVVKLIQTRDDWRREMAETKHIDYDALRPMKWEEVDTTTGEIYTVYASTNSGDAGRPENAVDER